MRDTLHNSCFTRMKYNLRKITYEFIRELCKTNPILSAVGGLQMNINIYYIKDYQILSRWPDIKTNPIQTQSNLVLSAVEWANLRKTKMNISYVKTTNYEQKTMNYVNNKQTQFPKWPKMNANLYVIEDYENETAYRPKKTNPKQSQCKAQLFITIGIIGQIILKINK